MSVIPKKSLVPAEPLVYRGGEFIKTFKISKTRFYEDRKNGRIRTIKAGRAVLITREAIEQWIALCEAESA